jgi:hypothetical protein
MDRLVAKLLSVILQQSKIFLKGSENGRDY